MPEPNRKVVQIDLKMNKGKPPNLTLDLPSSTRGSAPDGSKTERG